MEDQEALDLAADWADISQGLRKDLGHQLFSQWIRPIQLGTFCKDTGTLNLFLPNADLSVSNFGKSTQAFDARVIQLGVKFQF